MQSVTEKFKNSIAVRSKGGVLYERYKYLKKYADKDDPLMQAYLEYARKAYFLGGQSCKKSSLFDTPEEIVKIEDLIIPKLYGNFNNTFWCEFNDVILPYILERKGKKYNFNEIEPLMVEGPYEISDEVSIQNGDVVIDCGANIGLFSAIAAHKGAKVYSFEPDKTIVKNYLGKTAKYNEGIQIFECALSDYSGKGGFSTDTVNVGGGRLQKDVNELDTTKMVEITTIDEFAEEHNITKIDFIKADIEGAERDMLRGATRVLKEYHPKLSICTYHLSDDKEVLERIVKSANPDYNVRHDYLKMYCWV